MENSPLTIDMLHDAHMRDHGMLRALRTNLLLRVRVLTDYLRNIQQE